MGVKTTIELSRKAAEEKYVELHLEVLIRQWRRLTEARSVLLDNSELEYLIEALDDQMCGGESFRNYLILEES